MKRPCMCQGFGFCEPGCESIETPRTDAEVKRSACLGQSGDRIYKGVSADFARALERQARMARWHRGADAALNTLTPDEIGALDHEYELGLWH